MARGRPSLRTPALIERLLAHILDGCTPAEAARAENLRPATLSHWIRTDWHLARRVLDARMKSLSKTR